MPGKLRGCCENVDGAKVEAGWYRTPPWLHGPRCNNNVRPKLWIVSGLQKSSRIIRIDRIEHGEGVLIAMKSHYVAEEVKLINISCEVVWAKVVLQNCGPMFAGRGISAETYRLDDVFPPDDIGSGPYTPFIIYTPHIIAAFLLIKIYSF